MVYIKYIIQLNRTIYSIWRWLYEKMEEKYSIMPINYWNYISFLFFILNFLLKKTGRVIIQYHRRAII